MGAWVAVKGAWQRVVPSFDKGFGAMPILDAFRLMVISLMVAGWAHADETIIESSGGQYPDSDRVTISVASYDIITLTTTSDTGTDTVTYAPSRGVLQVGPTVGNGTDTVVTKFSLKSSTRGTAATIRTSVQHLPGSGWGGGLDVAGSSHCTFNLNVSTAVALPPATSVFTMAHRDGAGIDLTWSGGGAGVDSWVIYYVNPGDSEWKLITSIAGINYSYYDGSGTASTSYQVVGSGPNGGSAGTISIPTNGNYAVNLWRHLVAFGKGVEEKIRRDLKGRSQLPHMAY